MERKLIVGLVMAMALGSIATAGHATAKKERRPLVTFEAEGSVLLPNPNDVTYQGITRNEFEGSCAVPANTQGLDAFVIELPQKVTRVDSMVYAELTTGIGLNQLDLFFFDSACNEMGQILAFEDVTPLMPRGTKFVLVRNWIGDPAEFVFNSTEAR